MIAKKFRLHETEVKKILRARKAHFSNTFIGNYLYNKGESSRFALVLSSKAAKTSVDRNFFRRRFYEFVRKNRFEFHNTHLDIVCLPKKGIIFNRRDTQTIADFDSGLQVVFRRLFDATKNEKEMIQTRKPRVPGAKSSEDARNEKYASKIHNLPLE